MSDIAKQRALAPSHTAAKISHRALDPRTTAGPPHVGIPTLLSWRRKFKRLGVVLAISSAVAQSATPMLDAELTRGVPERGESLSCLTQASATVEVGTLRFGVHDSVLVQPGEVVRKGQVLAVLDSRAERAEVIRAQSKLRERAGGARVTKVPSTQKRRPQPVDQQATAKAQLNLALQKLAQRTITSPLSGVIVDRHVSVEDRVVIIKIAKINPLRVFAVVPAALFARVKTGMEARVVPELDGGGHDSHTATVASVDSTIDSKSKTFRAQLTLPNNELELPAGMRCRVEFAS